MPKKHFYAVSVGRQRGIFPTWAECQKQVDGFKNAKFKGFKTLQEAQKFIGIFGSANENVEPPPKAKPAAKRAIPEEPAQKPKAAKRPRVQSPKSEDAASSNSWQVFISFDGGSRGNPGLAGSGAEVIVLERNSKNIQKARRKIHLRKYVGTSSTCNMAEWQGVLSGLLQVVDEVETFQKTDDNFKPKLELNIQGDSQLVIRQLDGSYQCKKAGLKKFKIEFESALKKLRGMTTSLKVSYQHVYRCDNAIADGLANEAMDAKRSWTTVMVEDSSDDDASDEESTSGAPTKVYAEV